jgi:biopolymer transport protein ExbD
VKRGTRIAANAALIVAMVVVGIVLALPLKTKAIKVDLSPPAEAAPVRLVMEADGRLTIEGKPSTLGTLPRDLSARFADVPRDEQQVLIEVRGQPSPDRLMAVIDRLQGHGWEIGLIGREAARGGLTSTEGTK